MDIGDVFPGSRRLVAGKVPRGQILLIGPPGVGKSVFCMQFLYQGLLAGETAILVTTRESAMDACGSMRMLGFDIEPYIKRGMFRIIDCYSWRIGNKPSSEYFVKNPADLSEISITIEGARNDFKNIRFGMDSITDLVLYSNEDRFAKFLQLVSSRIKMADGMGIYAVTAGAHGERFMTLLRSMLDGVIEMAYDESSGKLQRLLRVFSLRKTRHDASWVPFQLTERGILIVDEGVFRCALCQRPIVGEPYIEIIYGKKFYFHSKNCAKIFKENMGFLLPCSDPVCGMEVDKKEAKYVAEYEGKTYFFCSPSCKVIFERKPEKYAR